MKLLPESSRFELLNNSLKFDTAEGNTLGRLESYTCKLVGQEKALYKRFRNDSIPGVNDLETLSPPQSFSAQLESTSPSFSRAMMLTRTAADDSSDQASSADSKNPLGRDKICRKTLFYLISTLNASFYPDYDFSNASAQEFSKEPSLQWVMRNVERQLRAVWKSNFSQLSSSLWAGIDDAVDLHECEIYSYFPDQNSDPYSEDGCIWSFNYFFYNVKLKRIVFFTCRAINSLYSGSTYLDPGFIGASSIDFDE